MSWFGQEKASSYPVLVKTPLAWTREKNLGQPTDAKARGNAAGNKYGVKKIAQKNNTYVLSAEGKFFDQESSALSGR